MKSRLLLLLLIVPGFLFAQKDAKPKISKALSSWREGKLDEAKSIIDAATEYEKTKDDLATVQPSIFRFVPQGGGDWRREIIDLSAYTQESIFIYNQILQAHLVQIKITVKFVMLILMLA